MGTHDDLFVIACRGPIAAAGIRHGDETAVVLFHIAIGKTKLAQHLDAPDFEPHKMIGVIDHAHLVRFRITHAYASFANLARAHFPLHLGLRFSRKDEMPSRKSSVVRIPALSWIASAIC